MSERNRLPKIHMRKSNKHIVPSYNAALQTFLMDRPPENITEVNNVIYGTVLAATE